MNHHQSPARSEKASQFRSVFVTLVLLAVIRLAVFVADRGSLEQDPDSYVLLAENLANTGVYGFVQPDGTIKPTAFRPAFFPWLLSWFVVEGKLQRWWIGCFQVALSLGCVGLLFSIGKRLGAPFAWLAAIVLALDPLMLRQSQLIMTETLTSFLFLLAWRVWLSCAQHGPDQGGLRFWGSTMGLGIVMGAAILTRPTNAPWVLLCTLSLPLVLELKAEARSSRRRQVLSAIAAAACVALFVIPWTLRNQQRVGKSIWATSHGGYTLMLANNPLLLEHFEQRGPSRNWDAEPFHRAWKDRRQVFSEATNQQILDPDYWRSAAQDQSRPQTLGELEDDVLAYKIAWLTILSDPTAFARSVFYRLGWFWAAWPNVASRQSLLIGVWYVATFAMALWGFVRLFVASSDGKRRERIAKWLPAILLVVSLSAIHSIYWGNMRMRAPLMGPVYLLALGWGVKSHASSKGGDRSDTIGKR